MNQISEFHSLINKLIREQQFPSTPEELYAPIEYVMSQGGKRLRPMLTLLACDMFGGKTEDALYPALAIEVFHNFTLVHDDIMDKAPLRRGKETVYKKWNSDIAILSGDTMFAMAYQYAVRTQSAFIPDILDVFSKAAIEVCEGQQYDMNFEQQDDVSIEDYIRMITLKTAVLLAASLKIGAIIASADKKSVQEIYNFGIALGIAFQLQDDFLDVYGDESTFGKKNGGDIVANKKTFLYLKAMTFADKDKARQLHQLYLDKGMNPQEKIEKVTAIFNQLEIEKSVKSTIDWYYQQAMSHLDHCTAPESRITLMKGFADQLYQRNH